jgi:homoserine kinase
MSRPAFRAAPLRVRVPATSANLGPGFDSFALALERFDDLVAQVVDEPGVRVDIGGEGADMLPRDGKHLVAKVMRRAFDEMGGQPRGLDLVCANRIPHRRGLGSSAAAIVGGLVLARALVVGGEELLPDERLLAMAAAMEGHPDNAAACLYGGFTLSWMQHDSARALQLTAHSSIRSVALIPSTTSSTRRTRGLLPDQVPHVDAAFTAARAGLLVHAMTSDPSLLLEATDERLHQQQRREAYPRSVDTVAKLRERGIPAVISGAGPTVLVLTTEAVLESALTQIKDVGRDRFEIAVLAVDGSGASVLPLA